MKRISNFIYAFIIITLIIPIMVGCFYGIPSADDFTNALWFVNGNKMSYLFKHSFSLWKNWQGTYFGNIIVALPIFAMWGIKGLHIEMLFCVILFFASYYFMLKQGLTYIKRETSIIIAYLLALAVLFARINIDETFYWHTGLSMYLIPLCLGIISVVSFLNVDKNKKWTWISAFCAFLSVGGSLQVAAFTMSLLIGVWLLLLLYKRPNCRHYIILVIAMIGVFLNVVAPGNFKRFTQGTGESHIRIVDNLFFTVVEINQTITEKFTFEFLFVLMLVVFVWAYEENNTKSVSAKKSLLVIVYSTISMIVVTLPVAIGYNGPSFPNRCRFVELVSAQIYLSVISVTVARILRNKTNWDNNKVKVVVGILITIQLIPFLNLLRLSEITPYKMVVHIARGDYQNEFNRETEILARIENSQDEDVVIDANQIEPAVKEKVYFGDVSWTNIKRTMLTSNPDDWVNQAVASFYGKNSVTVLNLE